MIRRTWHALVEFRGSRKNNIVISGNICPYGSFHGNSVFLDPTAPPTERFKVIYMAILKDDELIARVKRERPWSVSPLGERKRTIILLGTSPDGLRWNVLKDVLRVHQSDTQTSALDVPVGRGVTLRLRLRAAKLFSFEVK